VVRGQGREGIYTFYLRDNRWRWNVLVGSRRGREMYRLRRGKRKLRRKRRENKNFRVIKKYSHIKL